MSGTASPKSEVTRMIILQILVLDQNLHNLRLARTRCRNPGSYNRRYISFRLHEGGHVVLSAGTHAVFPSCTTLLRIVPWGRLRQTWGRTIRGDVCSDRSLARVVLAFSIGGSDILRSPIADLLIIHACSSRWYGRSLESSHSGLHILFHRVRTI